MQRGCVLSSSRAQQEQGCCRTRWVLLHISQDSYASCCSCVLSELCGMLLSEHPSCWPAVAPAAKLSSSRKGSSSEGATRREQQAETIPCACRLTHFVCLICTVCAASQCFRGGGGLASRGCYETVRRVADGGVGMVLFKPTRLSNISVNDMQFAPPANAFEEEEGAPTEGVTKLYGEWQTVAWAPPAAKDGVVPKNERGNVNVPPYAQALPAGVQENVQKQYSYFAEGGMGDAT